ncbi:helix-turn-helix domain-containing protein [Prevotella sp. AM23-5]|uniref:helix-turn-helix domain-containing protein n=1 Tax=Prevotellaceae TaxID=171552 RepID=UPI000E507596|nr:MULTISPECIES: AraC family transcriptional regulator [Prevotellaceae]RHN90272.1 helix-turn-helix domain-containing protein [Prevotella sp. AM23-5]
MRSYKPYIIKLCIVFLCFWSWLLTSSAQKVETNDYFYVLNTRQGLSDNRVLQMMQLTDGRLAVRTPKGINLYDGRRFSLIPLPAEKAESITKYKGQTHLYADSQDRLWVKEYQKIFCILLAEGRLLEHPLDALPGNGKVDKMKMMRNCPTGNAIQDLFVDSRKNVWVVMGDSLLNTQDGNLIHLKKEWGGLQDLDTDGKQVYAFMDSGIVAVFQNDKLVYTASAYSAAEAINQDPELILQVRALVEQHLEDGEYGVEQLAQDLCMERTGLYKKLTALTNTTPVAFIRSIRLHRAAALLQEGKQSVNEITFATEIQSYIFRTGQIINPLI